MSEKAKVKSEKRTSPFEGGRGDDKVKVTLSVHQVVNYTQEVYLTPEEIEEIESWNPNDIIFESYELHNIIKEHIDFNKIYDRNDSFLDCDIIENEQEQS